MNTKTILLSAAFMLMSWQQVFSGAPDFPEKLKVATTAQSQGLFSGNVPPDVTGRILANLSFKDGWVFLGVNKTHRNHTGVWTVFANLHGYASVIKDGTTAEEICGEIIVIEKVRGDLRIQVQSANPITPELMTSFLQRAQEKSFLWNTLIDTLLRKTYPHFSIDERQAKISKDAQLRSDLFAGVSNEGCRAYLEAMVARKNPDGTSGVAAENAQVSLNYVAFHGRLGFISDRGAVTSGYDYLVTIAAQKNSDGSPGVGSENAQEMLNESSCYGKLGFTNDRGTPTSGYDYLVEISKRMNPDGTPGLGAKRAQKMLHLAAYKGILLFTGDRGTPTSGYDYLVGEAAGRNSDGTPSLEAKNAQVCLNHAAFHGKQGFTHDRGTPTSNYDYLVGISKRKNPDGTPGLGAKYAQNLLRSLRF